MLFSKNYTRIAAPALPFITEEDLRFTREGDPWTDEDWLESGLKRLMSYHGEHYSYTGKKGRNGKGQAVFLYVSGQDEILVDKNHQVHGGEIPVADENTVGSNGPYDQIHFADVKYDDPSLIFQGPSDYIFMIKPDGSIQLGPQATIDDASRAFWSYVCQMNPFVDALKKQGLRDWLQRKRALDSRDLHAVELLIELEQILGV